MRPYVTEGRKFGAGFAGRPEGAPLHGRGRIVGVGRVARPVGDGGCVGASFSLPELVAFMSNGNMVAIGTSGPCRDAGVACPVGTGGVHDPCREDEFTSLIINSITSWSRGIFDSQTL